MKIALIITTYNRPEMLMHLLDDIEKQKGEHTIKINIVNDKSDKDYSRVRYRLDDTNTFRYNFAESAQHCGKVNYWCLVDYLFKILKENNFDYLIQIPDDVRLTDHFFDEAIRLYNSIKNSHKACLNLLNDYGRNGMNLWTGTSIRHMGEVMETGWVDMCYIADKRFLSALDYEIKEVSQVWTTSENHSSGVGMQISLRLKEAGLSMYQVKSSLVIHGAHESVMHPNHRKGVPLITNHIKDHITATMATMPERMNACEEVVVSLLPQVTELQVYLNNFDYVPEFLLNSKIKILKSQECSGDLGDAGKFYLSSEIKGYHFTVDDDIIYPSDYCQRMVESIEQYKRKCIITLHGRKFLSMPVQSYYHCEAHVAQCTKGYKHDNFIHIPGTGVMAYHTDTMKFDISMFRTSNMADIWAAVAAQSKGIPFIAMKHTDAWIKLSRLIDDSRSIYYACHKSDKFQTDIVNAVDWKLNTVL